MRDCDSLWNKVFWSLAHQRTVLHWYSGAAGLLSAPGPTEKGVYVLHFRPCAARLVLSSFFWFMGRSWNSQNFALLKLIEERFRRSVKKNSFHFYSVQCNCNELQYSTIYILNIHFHRSSLSFHISSQMLQCLILKISRPLCIFPITQAARLPPPPRHWLFPLWE